MEGAERGYAFATGMSAVFSTFAALLDSGDHIVSCQSIFGSTQTLFNNILPKWNISTSYFRINEIERIESLIQPNTKILYAESPTNPAVDILDLELLGDTNKPFFPCVTVSRQPGASVVITGLPDARASRTDLGVPSL